MKDHVYICFRSTNKKALLQFKRTKWSQEWSVRKRTLRPSSPLRPIPSTLLLLWMRTRRWRWCSPPPLPYWKGATTSQTITTLPCPSPPPPPLIWAAAVKKSLRKEVALFQSLLRVVSTKKRSWKEIKFFITIDFLAGMEGLWISINKKSCDGWCPWWWGF